MNQPRLQIDRSHLRLRYAVRSIIQDLATLYAHMNLLDDLLEEQGIVPCPLDSYDFGDLAVAIQDNRSDVPAEIIDEGLDIIQGHIAAYYEERGFLCQEHQD